MKQGGFFILFFIVILAFCIGEYALEKYKNDTKERTVKFWKRILIVFGYGAFSIFIIPIAIAKWAVNTTLNFKDEEDD